MIRPVNEDAVKDIAKKLGDARFACTIKGGEEEEGEEDQK